MAKCPECKGEDIELYAGTATNGIPDGRLGSHDVTPIIFAGCAECSHTLWTVNADRLVGSLDPHEITSIVDKLN